MVMRFKDAARPRCQGQISAGGPRTKDHACRLSHRRQRKCLASDGRWHGPFVVPRVSPPDVETPANNAEAEKLFGALARAVRVTMPMSEDVLLAHRFGMVADKFARQTGW